MSVAPGASNSNTLSKMRECYVMTLVLMILVAVERLVFQAVVAVEFGAFYHFIFNNDNSNITMRLSLDYFNQLRNCNGPHRKSKASCPKSEHTSPAACPSCSGF